eukprot:jgi/Botrbrau1/7114/Bobra.0165s0131.1
MAAVDPMFVAVINKLMSTQNEERKQAENLFNEYKKQPDVCVTSLVMVLRTQPEPEPRALCAVLLRKVLTKDDPPLFNALSSPVQTLLKQELLNCLREESIRTIATKVSDAVAELASSILTGPGWPELLPYMFQCVQSNVPLQMECALIIFAQLAHYILETVRQYLGTLHGTLAQCLASPHSDVAVAAMRAATTFILAVDDSAERQRFQDLLPHMLSVLAQSLNRGEELAAQEVLELFIELAESQPRFLRRNLNEVAAAMIQVAISPAVEESTRQLAAEFLVTLCEAREKAPGMMRKLPDFPQQLFNVLLAFLLDIEDDPLWHSADTESSETEGEGPLYETGQECLDRIALSLGGNTVVPLASRALPEWIMDPDWKKRHAALICLAQIAEGCVKVMHNQLDGLVDLCMRGLQDPHAKVRWAACQAIGQMCTDLGPELQSAKHQLLAPGLMGVMDDFSQPRVQAHAAAAIVNFSENCDQDVLAPYLDALTGKLLGLLQHGQRLVQEGALTAMASVADCAKASFIRYYDQVMPLLREILQRAVDKTHWLLRAKALECISLVGMAIGRDRFREDAHKVLVYMQQLQATGLAPEDPTSGYMLQAGARLCKCLGEEFLPYLSVVMPPLLNSAQLRPDVAVLDTSDEEDDNDEVETIYVGDRKISIHTTILEEKATACNMLCCYASELNEGFYPYVEQVTNIMVPLLRFYFHEEVRQAAVQSLPALLRCAQLAAKSGNYPMADMGYVKQMLDFMWGPFMEAMTKEPDTECLVCMLDSLEDIIGMMGSPPQLLTLDQLSLAFDRLSAILDESALRRTHRLKRQQAEDFDEEEAEALQEENEEEEELLDGLAACLTAVLRNYGDSALYLMDYLMPKLGSLLDASRSSEERRVGICIVDDILEHSAACSQKYMGHLVEVLVQGCRDPDANLRQCSVYGLGVLAQHRPEAFQSIAQTALQLMVDILSQPDARSEEKGNVTDNAASSLGKVLEYHSNIADENLASTWLRMLPLTHDTVEARIVHDQLLRLVEKGDTRVLGRDNSNLHVIFAIFARILAKGTDLVEADVAKRMAVVLQQMHANMRPEVVTQVVSRLKPKEQNALQQILQAQQTDQ